MAEAGLLAIFLLHVFTAFGVVADKRNARPVGYAVTASKGGNSKLTASAAVAEFSAFGSAGWLVARFTAMAPATVVDAEHPAPRPASGRPSAR